MVRIRIVQAAASRALRPAGCGDCEADGEERNGRDTHRGIIRPLVWDESRAGVHARRDI